MCAGETPDRRTGKFLRLAPNLTTIMLFSLGAVDDRSTRFRTYLSSCFDAVQVARRNGDLVWTHLFRLSLRCAPRNHGIHDHGNQMAGRFHFAG
jgi:hypothetical protein